MEKLQDTIFAIDASELIPKAIEKRDGNWRLVQICCAYVKEQYEITYSFAKDYEIENLRVVVPKDGKVESISRIYNAAIFYENEMSELFGCPIVNMEVDLKNKFIRIKEETPFIDKTDKTEKKEAE